MIVPSTYQMALILAIAGLFLWGSWANTLKLSGKWRFELYYYDFAFGAALAAGVAAFTFGEMGQDMSFTDTVLVVGKRQLAWAMAAGAVYNLGNILLLGAMSVSGMAVAFPVAFGLSMALSIVLGHFTGQPGKFPIMPFAGAGAVLVGVVAMAVAYRTHASDLVKAGKRKRASGIKGVIIAIVSGLLMGSLAPLMSRANVGEIGLGPYAQVFMFALGMLFSTAIYNLYFMNLPVQGEAVEFFSYFRGTLKQHLMGILGGTFWASGMLCLSVAASAPARVGLGPSLNFAFSNGGTLLAALWGLLLWGEFGGSSGKAKIALSAALLLIAAGIGVAGFAAK